MLVTRKSLKYMSSKLYFLIVLFRKAANGVAKFVIKLNDRKLERVSKTLMKRFVPIEIPTLEGKSFLKKD